MSDDGNAGAGWDKGKGMDGVFFPWNIICFDVGNGKKSALLFLHSFPWNSFFPSFVFASGNERSNFFFVGHYTSYANCLLLP